MCVTKQLFIVLLSSRSFALFFEVPHDIITRQTQPTEQQEDDKEK